MPGTYPSLTTILPSYYNEERKEFPGDKTVYLDGGAVYRGYGSTSIRRWTINYSSQGGIIAAEAAQFVTLANDNQYSDKDGSLLGFNFTPRGESALGNVHFDEGGFVIRRGGKVHIYIVEIRLIKRP
jgi:hypothetical protein